MNTPSVVPYINDPDPQTVVLTREDVEELRVIVREVCNEELSEEEAWHRATQLVALGRIVVRSTVNRDTPGTVTATAGRFPQPASVGSAAKEHSMPISRG